MIFDCDTCSERSKYGDTVEGNSTAEGIYYKEMTLELSSVWWGKASHVRVSRVPSSEKEKEMQRLQDERELGMVEVLEQVGEDEAG